eukprot:1154577-Pelagomonas_calceolata.AAC.7
MRLLVLRAASKDCVPPLHTNTNPQENLHVVALCTLRSRGKPAPAFTCLDTADGDVDAVDSAQARLCADGHLNALLTLNVDIILHGMHTRTLYVRGRYILCVQEAAGTCWTWACPLLPTKAHLFPFSHAHASPSYQPTYTTLAIAQLRKAHESIQL